MISIRAIKITACWLAIVAVLAAGVAAFSLFRKGDGGKAVASVATNVPAIHATVTATSAAANAAPPAASVAGALGNSRSAPGL